LGASIVWGADSTDGNGFRYGLRNQLVYDGNAVNMIGTIQHGTMLDNDNEGHQGFKINEIQDIIAADDIPSQPNVVILHVGTNDCLQNYQISGAPARWQALIQSLLDSIPGVTIITSTLLPNGNFLEDGTPVENLVKGFNAAVPGIVAGFQARNQKVLYVDMHSSFFSIADITASDGTHPTDAGYQKMAAVWYQGFQLAAQVNWLTPPATVAGVSDDQPGGSGDTTCQKVPGNAIGPIQTQRGSGETDGSYVHVPKFLGNFGTSAVSITDWNALYWADINGDVRLEPCALILS
jgi:lysophospholipase L1-like esterase